MKLCRIYIVSHNQFQDVEIDFTNPKTGDPFDKVCFIGTNGTGKSTLLRLVWYFYELIDELKQNEKSVDILNEFSGGKFVFWIRHSAGESLVAVKLGEALVINMADEATYNQLKVWLITDSIQQIQDKVGNEKTWGTLHTEHLKSIFNTAADGDLVVFSPSEADTGGYYAGLKVGNANEKEHSSFKQVSQRTLGSFWQALREAVLVREKLRDSFERSPQNVNKTKQELIAAFDCENPSFFETVAPIWSQLLSKSHLEFDPQKVIAPIQIDKDFEFNIILKSTKTPLRENALSTGIRNFLFRLGFLRSLFFERRVGAGAVLIDEPENSLFPDFLLGLVKLYETAVVDKAGDKNVQLFFATHNPIIAAQFEPLARIILDWTENGFVTTRHGVAPEGDDPNDLLQKDFEMSELMSEKGIEMHEKYIDLKKQLARNHVVAQQNSLIDEIEKIAGLYNFA